MNTVSQVETPVLGPEHNGVRMTLGEFDAVADWDENYRYELIHGVLVVNPIPLPQERGPNEYLGHLLLKYREDHPQGASLDDTLIEHNLQVSDSRRWADRVIWAGLGRQPDPANDTPAIVVEFVSAGRRNWQRDYVEKRNEYLALGVREYWLIDRFGRTTTAFRKTDGGPGEQVVQEDQVYRTELLPGFELPLGKLLAVADRWER